MFWNAWPTLVQHLRRRFSKNIRGVQLRSLRTAKRRRCLLERLESRQVMVAAIWTNVLQPLDVFPNDTVSPFDALLIINEINSREYADRATGRLPDEITGSAPAPMIDVTCDQFVTPLDALLVINAINSGVTPPGWKFTSEGGSVNQTGRFEATACAPRLVEGSSLVTQIQSSLTLTNSSSALKVTFDAPVFDTSSTQSMRDAFEIVVVDDQGQPLALPFQYNQEASSNWSEGLSLTTGPGTTPEVDSSTNRIATTFNLSGVSAGTPIHVIARLLNNDRDDATSVIVRSVELVTAASPAPRNQQPLNSRQPASSPVNIAALEDVSSTLTTTYGRTTLTTDPSVVASSLELTNSGLLPVHGQLIAVFKNFSDPTIGLVNPDGFTPDGDAYLNLSDIASSGIVSGQTISIGDVRFRIATHARFTYQLQLLSGLNHAPILEALPQDEVAVGGRLAKQMQARDLDGDRLSYRIINGPAGLQVSATDGTLNWTPTSADVGRWTIDVGVSDPFGAQANQRWEVVVKQTIPNRPPIITSTPDTDAVIASPFEVLTYATGSQPVAATMLPRANGLASLVSANTGEEQLGLLSGRAVLPAAGQLDASIPIGLGEPDADAFKTPFVTGIGVPLDLEPQSSNTYIRDVQQVVAADVNRDSIPDLIVAADLNPSSGLIDDRDLGFVIVRLSNGDGSFREGWRVALPKVTGRVGRVATMHLRDVTGDSLPDLIVTTIATNQTLVYAASTSGLFSSSPIVSANVGNNITNTQLADVNRDGKLDLVFFENEQVQVGGRRGIGIQLGDGTGQFVGDALIAAQNNNGGLGYVADVDGANGPDLLRLNYSNTRVEAWLNDGQGNFAAPIYSEVRGNYDANNNGSILMNPTSAIIDDFDGDGVSDVVVSCYQTVLLLIGQGDGRFGNGTGTGNRVLVVNDGDSPQWVGLLQSSGAAPDLNGDGRLDFVFGDIQNGSNIMIGLGQADGTFSVAQYNANFDDDIGLGIYRTPRSVPYLAIADFNADGVNDIAAGAQKVGEQPGAIGLFLGNQPGTLRAPAFVVSYKHSNYNVERGRGGESTTGDFNNDGLVDIVTYAGSGFGGAMFFAASRGDGSFDAYTPGLGGVTSGNSLTSLDIDRDGNLDLAWINGGQLGAAYGLGNGAFQSLPTLTLSGSQPGVSKQALQVDDFNRDGYPDLVVRLQTGNIDSNVTTRIEVLLYNPGNRRYDRLVDPQNILTNTPRAGGFYNDESIGLGDLNNDGQNEFFTFSRSIAPSTPARFMIWEQTGNLGNDASILFRKTVIENPTFIASDASVHAYVVDDFNHDGLNDIAYSTHSTRMVVAFGGGDFSFGDSTTYITNGFLINSGDFNGDGITDIASMWGAGFLNFSRRPYASVLLGRLDGTFSEQFPFLPTAETTFNPAIGDFNGDGRDDFTGLGGLKNLEAYVAKGQGLTDIESGDIDGDGTTDLVSISSDISRVKLLLGGVNESFERQHDLFTDLLPVDVELVDADEDNLLDILTANRAGKSLTLLKHASATEFQRQDIALPIYPNSMTLGDLNGDGRQDVVATSDSDEALVVLLGGNGSFAVSTTLPLGFNSADVALGDVNGDGKPDLVLTDSTTDRIVILAGKGDGTFLTPTFVPSIASPDQVALADMNHDGRVDVIVTQPDQDRISMLFNRGNGKFTTPQTIQVGDKPQDLRVGDMNSDGRPDLLVSNLGDDTLSVILNRFDPTQVWQYQPTAIDPDGDPVTFELTSAPGGMLLDTATQIIYWAPMPEQLGRNSVVLTASDGRGGSTDQGFQVTVTAPVSVVPPIFTSTPVTTFDADTVYRYEPNVQASDSGPKRFSLVEAPEGMSVDPATGAIEWDARSKGIKLYANNNGTALPERNQNFGQIEAPDSPSLRTASVTAEGWFNFVDPQGALVSQMLSKGSTGNRDNVSWGIEYFFGTIRARVGRANGSDLALVTSPAPVNFNRWTHLAMTFDDSTRVLTLIIDGKIVGSAVSTEAIGYSNAPFYTGGAYATATRMRVWNVARSVDEISRDRLADVPSNSPGLIMDLRFNESRDVSTLLDASTANNHASLIGTPDLVNYPARIPTLATTDSHRVVLRVDDGQGGVAEQSFTISARLPYSAPLNGVVFDDLNGNGTWEQRAGESLLFNGDFSSGLLGFDTDFIERENRTGFAWLGDSQVTVTTDAVVLPNTGNLRAHTNAAANDFMLIANGKDRDVVAWRQSVSTQSGQSYEFSFWAMRPNSVDAARLSVRVNGQAIGGEFALNDVGTGSFKRFLGSFVADSAQTVVEIVLLGSTVPATPGLSGVDNSVAIDDLLLIPGNAPRVLVSGKANPYLAGMPVGTTAFGSTAPASSPPSLPVSDGEVLRIRASGGASAGPFPARGPDGFSENSGVATPGSANGISQYRGPSYGALIGLFLDDSAPSNQTVPPALDFRSGGNVPSGIEFDSLQPALRQVFFIGDGLNSSGIEQTFVVPTGATRLFLANASSGGWQNNGGNFEVQVFRGTSEPVQAGRSIFVDENLNNRYDSDETITVTDSRGAFRLQTPGTGARLALMPQSGKLQTAPALPYEAIELQTVATRLLFGSQDISDDLPPRFITSPSSANQLTNEISPRVAITAPGVYSYQAFAQATDGQPVTYAIAVGPQGMAIDRASGLIEWHPTAADAGPNEVVVRATDSQSRVTLQRFTLDVSVNTSPIIVTPEFMALSANVALEFQVLAQDAEQTSLRFELFSSPAGMTIQAESGLITWLPTAAQSTTALIRVSDGAGGITEQSLSLSVSGATANDPPVIRIPSLSTAIVQRTFAARIQATDTDQERLSYTLLNGPAGLTLSTDGVVEWQPSNVGSFDVRVRVTDSRGASADKSFTIQSLARVPVSTLDITSSPNTAAVVGTVYAYDMIAPEAVLFELVTRPVGMSIDPQRGTVRWMPAKDQLGVHTVQVRAYDLFGHSSVQNFNVAVRSSSIVPTIASAPPTEAAVGQTFVYAIQLSNPARSPLTFGLSVKPEGMTIDAASGVISWTPAANQVGSATVVVRAQDAIGNFSSQAFTIAVAAGAVNRPPVIQSIPLDDAVVGRNYTYQLAATDPESTPITYAVRSAPSGLTVNSSTGAITWTPTSNDVGTVNVVLTATDAQGGIGVQSIAIDVRPENRLPTIRSNPKLSVSQGGLYQYDVLAADPDREPLFYALDAAPAGMSIDALGRIRWQTQLDSALGARNVIVRVQDGLGGATTQSYTLGVVADTQAPRLTILVTGEPVLYPWTTEPAIVRVIAADDVGLTGLVLKVDGQPVELSADGTTRVYFSAPGNGRLEATATDAAGNVGRAIGRVSMRSGEEDGGGNPAPEANITSISDGSTVVGLVNVIGNAAAPDFESYTLSYRRADQSEYQVIKTSRTTVTNGTLGQWDTTLLENDSYVLKLEVRDTFGSFSAIEVQVGVSGQFKLGNFRLSFEDMTIPVAGIPISIVRTYDTLRADRDSDFGYGWRLEYRSADLRSNLPKSGLEDIGIYTPFKAGTRVYVTLPGGERAGFTFTPEIRVLPGFGRGNDLVIATPRFTADRASAGTLSAGGGGLIVNEFGELFASGGVPWNPASPDFGGYQLTLSNGLRYSIDGNGLMTSATDPNGNRVDFSEDGIRSSAGQAVTFQRDGRGRVVSITDPAGHTQNYTYDSQGNLTSTTDRDQRTTQFRYRTTPAHILEQVIDPLGRTGARMDYDADGRLQSVRNGAGDVQRTQYDLDAQLVTRFDALGNATTTGYDDLGNVVLISDALGGTSTFAYDQNGFTTTEVDALGNTTRYRRDSEGRPLSVSDPNGNVTSFTYDRWGNVLTTTDALGNAATNRYDQRGNLLASIDATGSGVEFAVDERGRSSGFRLTSGGVFSNESNSAGFVVRSTDWNGIEAALDLDAVGRETQRKRTIATSTGTSELTSSHVYSPGGLLLSKTSEGGATTRYEYDAAGQVVAQIDALNNRTTFDYDSLGQLTTTTFADGTSQRSAYDANGNRISSTDQLGRVTHYRYDQLSRLVETIYPDSTPSDLTDNPRATTVFDAIGQVLVEVDPSGKRVEYEYDAAGNVIALRDSAGNRTRFVFDAAGRQLAVIDSLGRKTEYQFDAAGRTKAVTHPDGTRSLVLRDATGQVLSAIDENGRATDYQYTSSSLLSRVTDANGHSTAYQYDARGLLIAITNALGAVTRFEYDAQGNQTKRVLPGGQAFTSSYDILGRLSRTLDANGNIVDYQYDSMSRLKERRASDGTTVEFRYGPSGLLLQSIDARGTTLFAYDTQDRLLSRTEPDGMSIQYTYNIAGQKTSMTTAAGVTRYEYDSAGRLARTLDVDNAVTEYNYDNASRLASTQFANGIVESYEYDLRDRLVRQTAKLGTTTVSDISYVLDPTGRLREKIADGVTSLYTFDAAYRIIQEEIRIGASSQVISYAYDAVGNRLTKQDSARGLTTYEYDVNDRLLREATGSSIAIYSWDANGNQLQRSAGPETLTNTWTVDNLLASTTVQSGANTTQTQYLYDAQADRVGSKVVGGSETRYLLDKSSSLAQVALEYSPGGIILAQIARGQRLISEQRGTNKSFLLADRSGSVTAILSATGTVIERLAYDSFGNQVAAAQSNSPFRFNGEARESGSGYDYLRARYYDPRTGRFISADPFAGITARPVSLHKYQYADLDPINNVDPTGNFAVSLAETTFVQGLMDTVRKSYEFIKKKQAFDRASNYLAAAEATLMFQRTVIGFLEAITTDTLVSGSFNVSSAVKLALPQTDIKSNLPNAFWRRSQIRNKLAQSGVFTNTSFTFGGGVGQETGIGVTSSIVRYQKTNRSPKFEFDVTYSEGIGFELLGIGGSMTLDREYGYEDFGMKFLGVTFKAGLGGSLTSAGKGKFGLKLGVDIEVLGGYVFQLDIIPGLWPVLNKQF